MPTMYALFSREDRNFAMAGGQVALFPSSAAASTFQKTSASMREDVTTPTKARTWDVVTVTIK